MEFPKSRILTTKQLIEQFIESNANGERFCFILGSGASVESGIPSGNSLEMTWMNCLMGVSDDYDTKAKDAVFTRQWAKKLYEDKLISHNFDEIETAWKLALKSKKSITSEYYFDGYFVSIGGFDALMMEFGKALFEDDITPSGTYNNLKNQCDKRAEQYKKQWDKVNNDPQFKQVLQSMNEYEKKIEDEREKEHRLTAWDYTRRGDRAYNNENYKEAIDFYSKAIDLRKNFASDYNNRGCAYHANKEYILAVEDFDKAYKCNECGNDHNHVAVNDSTVIREFSKNYYCEPHTGCAWKEEDRYCVLVKWSDFVKSPQDYIEEAFNKRTQDISENIVIKNLR